MSCPLCRGPLLVLDTEVENPPHLAMCAVCLEENVLSPGWGKLPCGHGFCKPCLKEMDRVARDRDVPQYLLEDNIIIGFLVMPINVDPRSLSHEGPFILMRSVTSRPPGPWREAMITGSETTPPPDTSLEP